MLPWLILILAVAPAPAPSILDRTMAELDSAFFDSYNNCQLEKMASYIAEEVEFYHDQGGVMTGRKAVVDAARTNICGKVTRKLVPGSLQSYPMKGYGAVVLGVHRFHHTATPELGARGEARFIHLWREKDGAWQMTRIISYDHVPVNP